MSKRVWETQILFRDELLKRLKFLDSHDSGTDILVTALISLSGWQSLDDHARGATLETGEMSNIAAVSLVIASVGLKELAATYSAAKVEKNLEGLDSISGDVTLSEEQRQALALAVDFNLLFKGRLKVMDIHAFLERELAFHLLERMHSFLKNDRNYIGFVTEPDIIGKMSDKWEQAVKVRCPVLEEVMNKAIGQLVISGYQIKNLHDLAQFDTDLTIAYSHSDFRHIKQFIGLLVSEALQAKLQLVPKRSSFFYRDGWEKSPDMHLEDLGGGRMVAHKDEVDMVLEFTDRPSRDRFRQVVDTYAKREFTTEKRLLFHSWYEPLYRLEVPVEGYNRIASIVIHYETHIAYAYVREDEAAWIVAWFKKELPDMEISTAAIWVNDAFFRYLHGEND